MGLSPNLGFGWVQVLACGFKPQSVFWLDSGLYDHKVCTIMNRVSFVLKGKYFHRQLHGEAEAAWYKVRAWALLSERLSLVLGSIT